MNWRVRVEPAVRTALNALASSGALSRRGLLLTYNSLWLELPHRARLFGQTRDPVDPDYFAYHVRFWDRGAKREFTFHVNDSATPGLLFVEDVDYQGPP
jgi:hypothetical protein